jgi:radical SAM superfamily enzyme
MESGYDPLLQLIRKGVTAEEHIEGGRRIVASGISLSEYVMPGLGGVRWSKEHALETARVLNQINPDFIRLRSLLVRESTPLHKLMEDGKFEPLNDDGMVHELRLFIENLEGIESTILSDHILNLLEDVEGKLPGDKDKMLAAIDRYLNLHEKEKLIFRMGRRHGYFKTIADLHQNEVLYERFRQVVEQYLAADPGEIDRDIDNFRQNHV